MWALQRYMCQLAVREESAEMQLALVFLYSKK